MIIFSDANQAKLDLKMKLSKHAWYRASAVVLDGSDYCVMIYVDRMDNSIRKIIPIVHNGITVKVDVANKKR
jgi:hypothetical protein